MTNPLPVIKAFEHAMEYQKDKFKEIDKIYPEILYSAKRISECGHQPVFKQFIPDGEPVELSPEPSQKLHNHSPSFTWGYCGSGPAKLALALLLDATTNPDTALAYYQEFKWDKVAEWGDEWSMLRSEILLWVEQQKIKQLEAMISRN